MGPRPSACLKGKPRCDGAHSPKWHIILREPGYPACDGVRFVGLLRRVSKVQLAHFGTRTSENPLSTKFAELPFHALGWIEREGPGYK